jgi:mono/diheme cytochrome c family protein
MFLKILKWTGLVLVLLIAGVTIATLSRQHLTYDAPYPNIKATTDTAVIAKGKHIALVAKGCVQCHSPVNNVDSMLKQGIEPSFAGAKEVRTIFGVIYSPNITPDAATGIGSMTDAEMARVLRYGIKKNGEAVLPFMQNLNMNDEEITAVISYLRSLEPVKNNVPQNEFTFLGKFAKAFMMAPALPQEQAEGAKKM